MTSRIDEMNVGIAYAGRWGDARYNGYAGDLVLYAATDGATATYPFYAKSVAWIGPVGPTRGTARVAIDGKVVATVDLRRTGSRRGDALRPVVEDRRQPHAHDHGRRQRPAGRDRRVHRDPLTPMSG